MHISLVKLKKKHIYKMYTKKASWAQQHKSINKMMFYVL